MRKTLISIVGTTILVIIITIIEILIFGNLTTPFVISNWIMGFSFFFWINRDDKFLNSIIISVFLPAIFIEGVLWGIGIWYDYQHIPILIASFYIFWKKKQFVNFRVVLISTVLITAWVLTVYFTGLAYHDIGFATVNLHGATYDWYPYFGLPLVIVLNCVIVYLIIEKEKG